MSDWNKIRDQFTEDEKAVLNAAIQGEVLCPRGCILDENKLGDDMSLKLQDAVTRIGKG
jgi:hypothetical protein